MLLAHEGERENVNEKLSSNMMVVMRVRCEKVERRCSWVVRAKCRYRRINIGWVLIF